VTSSWFFLSTLNYDARSNTHQRKMMFTGKLVSIYANAMIGKCTCNHSWTFPLPHNCG